MNKEYKEKAKDKRATKKKDPELLIERLRKKNEKIEYLEGLLREYAEEIVEKQQEINEPEEQLEECKCGCDSERIGPPGIRDVLWGLSQMEN